MTDIGESISIAAASNMNEKCWYCEEEPQAETIENKTVADPQTEVSDNEDFPPENYLHNDASKLGTNVGNRPDWQIKRPGDDVLTSIVPGAHHLIPGNASLAKAMKDGLDEYMSKDGPNNLESDIGYDVNNASNGVWLPGNYAVRPDNEDYTQKWTAYDTSFKNDYAVRAMKLTRVQFHDAHSKYNKNVLKTLRSLKEKMFLPTENKCPICGKENNKKTRPPYGLVARLNFVSLQHRQMLTGLGSKKSRKLKMVSNGYYTSSRVYAYFGVKKP